MKKLKLLILSLMLITSGISERSYAAFVPAKATTENKNEESIGNATTLTEENKETAKVTPEKYELPEKKEVKGGKSYYIALALVVLLGVLGIHRYYLGKPMSALRMTLTGGGFGILWLTDIYLIATGKLKPAFGNYKGKKGIDKTFKPLKKN